MLAEALADDKSKLSKDEGLADRSEFSKREIVVYWYSFSNHCTVCIHYGISLVGNNLNNTLRTP